VFAKPPSWIVGTAFYRKGKRIRGKRGQEKGKRRVGNGRKDRGGKEGKGSIPPCLALPHKILDPPLTTCINIDSSF